MARGKKSPRSTVQMYGEPDRFLPLLDDEPSAAGAAITFQAKVWLWKQGAGWHFATVPPAESARIRAEFKSAKRGWGSVPVTIRIGDTEWQTSLFPQGKTGTYLLAIKASVRKAENIEEGSTITAVVSIKSSGSAASIKDNARLPP